MGSILVGTIRPRLTDDIAGFLPVKFLDNTDIAVEDDQHRDVELHQASVDAVHDLPVNPWELQSATNTANGGGEYLGGGAEREGH